MNRKKNNELLLNKVKQAEEIIDTSWSDSDLCIKTLSQRLEVDGKVLGIIFKKLYGEPINARINRLRIKESEKLLNKNDHKIFVIASLSGFSSRIRFYQVFKRVKGVSPKEYIGREKI